MSRSLNIFSLLWLILVLVGAGGWIWNIVKLIHTSFDPITGLAVGRVIGIFVAPLGAILGYF